MNMDKPYQGPHSHLFTVRLWREEVGTGQIILVPAGTPHKFVNSGEGPLRQTSVHPSPHMIAEWLES